MVKYGLGNYLAYVKDNPKGYWFKRKLYGWGWVPASLEGWIVTLMFVVLLLINGFYLASLPEPSGCELGVFFGVLIVLIVGLIGTCYWKGEKPKWTWGR